MNKKGSNKTVPRGSNAQVAQISASVPPCSYGKVAQAAKAMVEKFKVSGERISLRTAYRHLAKGTTPSVERCIGRDEKTYPRHPRGRSRIKSPVSRELALTYQALNRADKKACQDGVVENDRRMLARIVSDATEMLERWETALP